MSHQAYYRHWIDTKDEVKLTIDRDNEQQELYENKVGIKPQYECVAQIANLFSRYSCIYNQLCDCYDQCAQIQRRPFIRKLIDSVSCRLQELKFELQQVEVFEYTYPDRGEIQLLLTPQDVDIVCPSFLPLETREKEMQFIMDQVFAGERFGEQIVEEEEIVEEEPVVVRNPFDDSVEDLEPVEEKEPESDTTRYAKLIQSQERTRQRLHDKVYKSIMDKNLYLELSGTKSPDAPMEVREKAAQMIQKVYRAFMEEKRYKIQDVKLKKRINMLKSSRKNITSKEIWEKIKEQRRLFRLNFYEKMVEEKLKEKAKIFKLEKGRIAEDISDEVRQWFAEWYKEVRVFDEYPHPEEGGSILVARGETFTTEEYLEWRKQQEKDMEDKKSSALMKSEKKLAAQEREKELAEAKKKEEKRIADYRKQRMNPDKDPGVLVPVSKVIDEINAAFNSYHHDWKYYDKITNRKAIEGYIKEIMVNEIYEEVHLELRPIVDEMMRLELALLKKALKRDYENAGIEDVPHSKKRKKPKKKKKGRKQKKDKTPPEEVFQELVDEGIVVKYPKTKLHDYLGDENLAASEMRAIPWTPSFPQPALGDVRSQVMIKCLLPLSSECNKKSKSVLLVGPPRSGKKMLINAVCSESNAVLFDLSPLNMYNKYPGAKALKQLMKKVNTISRLMQPSVILVQYVEKIFYKKIPKEEKEFDPKRMKGLFKNIVKPITDVDKIIVLGTSTNPWLARNKQMMKSFKDMVMVPRTDYGSISSILRDILKEYNGVDPEVDVHSLAQTLRGYDIGTIMGAVRDLMSPERLIRLKHAPLQPMEILDKVQSQKDLEPITIDDYNKYLDWYKKVSPWSEKLDEYKEMLEGQRIWNMKMEKKKKMAAKKKNIT